MKKKSIYQSTFSIIFPLGLLSILFVFFSKSDANENTTSQNLIVNTDEDKQRGAHVFGIVDSTNFEPLHQNNLEWVTLVSWGYQDDYNSAVMTHHNGDSVYMRQHNIHWRKRIEQVRAAGFKVFFKPHLWVTHPTGDKWRSDIFPTSDENWELWKESYRNFIFRYATIAEEANAEMFCIGIEFSRLTIEKPEFWKELIREIRTIYSGKITYAANWYKEYDKVTFWEDLDYIGIQAYFPLTKKEYPSVKQISKGWNRYLHKLESTHKRYNRQILFTEMGYRSTANSAVKPWIWAEKSSEEDNLFSVETQANCYEAFFNSVWEKEWFAGVHIWQLRSDYIPRKGRNNTNFTPQGKPAEFIISSGFEKSMVGN